MRKEACHRCEREFRRDVLIQWLDGLDTLSPKFCPRCYDTILENWQEGDDVGDRGNDFKD